MRARIFTLLIATALIANAQTTGPHIGMGPPITDQLDGKQYVALMGGVGAGGAGPGNQATPLHPHLLVFTLDGTAQLPAPPPAAP